MSGLLLYLRLLNVNKNLLSGPYSKQIFTANPKPYYLREVKTTVEGL